MTSNRICISKFLDDYNRVLTGKHDEFAATIGLVGIDYRKVVKKAGMLQGWRIDTYKLYDLLEKAGYTVT